ncbi:LOW QUALITY PROTEIN: hypothetical protein N5P37_009370 [Trichoderma harzianum]|nr:LOW QUALITY PROTEIN: hypothetical protein N5P37_009370 [Trichoderma harzianum]
MPLNQKFFERLKAGWAYTNNMLAMVNAAIGAMNFYCKNMRMFVLELFQLTRGFISRIWVFWVTMENDPGPFSLVQIDELSARLSAPMAT